MSSESTKLKVNADIKNNRLVFLISGRVTKKQLEGLYTDVRFCVADLKPGFNVITDVSECRIASLNAVVTFRKIMNFLIASKVGKVVRVSKSTSLLYKQMINFSVGRRGYKPIYVQTMEEAQTWLEENIDNPHMTYSFHQFPVNFTLKGAEGSGYLHEISPTECSIEEASPPPESNEQLTLHLKMASSKSSIENFELQCYVEKAEHNAFTAKFVKLDEDQINLLIKCIGYEVQQDA